jgi:prolipoprotein diacylglyceryltransferase
VLAATVLLPLACAFFAHLCYCLTAPGYMIESHSFGYLFAFWQPGYMFYGGILGAAAALLLAGGKHRMQLLEAYSPAAALMVAAARIAEGFAGQGYGEYWFEEEMFFCRFPFMTYDPYYESWAWALFVAEALVAVLILIVLLAKKPTWAGDSALLGLGLYAAAQVVLESLRRDEFLRWGFVRIEEVFSGAAVLLVLICYCIKAGRGHGLQKAACFVVFLLMATFCLLLEFATEGRIPFLLFLEVYQCYLAMAGACCVIAACVLWMRRLCNNNCAMETNV